MTATGTLSGVYRNVASGLPLALGNDAVFLLFPDHAEQADAHASATYEPTLRADKFFFLSKDDGQIGRLGDPDHVRLLHDGTSYKLWVDPRGFSKGAYELALVLADDQGSYSSKYLGVDSHTNKFVVKNAWPTEDPKDLSLAWQIDD